MAGRLASLASLLLLIAGPLAAAPTAGETKPAREHAEKAVFLLQYVGSDYAVAVRDGKVLDEAEYRENTEFAASAAEHITAIQEIMTPAVRQRVQEDLEQLRRAIAERADPPTVRALTQSLIPALIDTFGLEPAPGRPPDAARAAKLYRENCVPCHGEAGRGDGPRAKELDPPPADFSDPARMDSVAPFVFYNALTLGVDGTAMASFRDSLSDEERWGLAFFLWSFRRRAPRPERTPARIALSLRDLATRSAAELAPEVARQTAASGGALDEAEARALIAELRARPELASDPLPHLANARAGLVEALRRIGEGDFDGAADRVTTAYLEDFEPLEREIDRRDPGVRRAFERALIDFRSAVRARDADEALKVAGRLENALADAERLFAQGSAGRPSPAIVVAALAAAAAIVAGIVLLWRGRGIGNPEAVG